MSNLENIFDSIYEGTQRTSMNVSFQESSVNRPAFESDQTTHDSLPSVSQEEFSLQTQIRPLFGKEGINTTPIGTHPDFIDLEGTDNGTKNHYVCTLFVDIKGSTRLSLLYPLDKVFAFKNAVIKTCIEVIRSFDGYVHRIMGDAVMAFFGGVNQEEENAVANALNCSITLRAILESSIKPWMERNGLDAKDFGFRIGCDYGHDHEVLWGSFGYANVGEVSATGLPVDMASKLQSLANKNQTMLGQGILDFIYWPEKYSQVKEKLKGGEQVKLPLVLPNLTNSDGTPLDYNMRILNYSKCLEYCALPRSFKESIQTCNVVDNIAITYRCFTVINGDRIEYITASQFLDNNLDLEFEVIASTRSRLNFPLQVAFIKTNHGNDTPEEERDVEQEPKVKTLRKIRVSTYDKSIKPYSKVVIKEATLYRGIHTMRCDIRDNHGTIVFRDWIGVMIK